MKLTLRVAALLVLVLAVAGAASADTVNLTLNSVSNSMGGYGVGPYNFTTNTGQSLQLVCDDFSHEVYLGESWTATSAPFPGVLALGTATQYKEIAWLVEDMFSPSNIVDPTAVGDIQWAIWDIFTPGVSSSDPSIGSADQGRINNLVNQAKNPLNYGIGNYSNITIYTPVGAPLGYGLPQEYFGITPVPEPGTLMLVAMGLCGLLVFRRLFSH
jgi:PEP-CTERM motif